MIKTIQYLAEADPSRVLVARRWPECLADVIHSHSGTKVFIEQEVPALTRVVNGRREHARMDLALNLNGSASYLDVSIFASFSCNPSLVSAASTRPGHIAKRAEKSKFDRHPHINLVPFILETTGRPGQHARKFISNLMKDADNSQLAIGTPDQPSRAYSTAPSPNNNDSCRYVNLRTTFARPCSALHAVPRYVKCQHRPHGNACRVSRAMWPCYDDTSSDDDEHNTDKTLLLLFADAHIAPARLTSLSEVDELKIALSCRFALDIFTFCSTRPTFNGPCPSTT